MSQAMYVMKRRKRDTLREMIYGLYSLEFDRRRFLSDTWTVEPVIYKSHPDDPEELRFEYQTPEKLGQAIGEHIQKVRIATGTTLINYRKTTDFPDSTVWGTDVTYRGPPIEFIQFEELDNPERERLITEIQRALKGV